MSRKEAGHLLYFSAFLASSVCWGPHCCLPWCTRMCASCCRIHIPLHTKSLIADFLVATALSSLSYHSKGWCLFVSFCTLCLFTPDLFFLLLFHLFKPHWKLVLSPPIFPLLSLKCIVTLRQILYFQNYFTNFHFSFVIFRTENRKELTQLYSTIQ